MQVPGWLLLFQVLFQQDVMALCKHYKLSHSKPSGSNMANADSFQPFVLCLLFCNDFSITLSWVNNYSQHATIMTNTKKKFHVRIGRKPILAKSPYISVILFSSLKLINIKYLFLDNQLLRRRK